MTGNYTQSAKGELVLGAKPLKAAGKVALAGDLDLSAAGTHPARTVTVLDHTGDAPTTGSFTGLREGSKLKLAGTTYRISYRGGDGNDVVLTAVAASSSSSPTAHPKSSSGTTITEARTENTARGAGFGWWPPVSASASWAPCWSRRPSAPGAGAGAGSGGGRARRRPDGGCPSFRDVDGDGHRAMAVAVGRGAGTVEGVQGGGQVAGRFDGEGSVRYGRPSGGSRVSFSAGGGC
ncbi:hypothetical protein ACRAWF_47255 [Streptomyces sp. L7]